MLWGATGIKAARKYVDEIDPLFPENMAQSFSATKSLIRRSLTYL